MSKTKIPMEFIERIHNMNLDVKTAHELASKKTNDLVETLMKEIESLKYQLEFVNIQLRIKGDKTYQEKYISASSRRPYPDAK